MNIKHWSILALPLQAYLWFDYSMYRLVVGCEWLDPYLASVLVSYLVYLYIDCLYTYILVELLYTCSI